MEVEPRQVFGSIMTRLRGAQRTFQVFKIPSGVTQKRFFGPTQSTPISMYS